MLDNASSSSYRDTALTDDLNRLVRLLKRISLRQSFSWAQSLWAMTAECKKIDITLFHMARSYAAGRLFSPVSLVDLVVRRLFRGCTAIDKIRNTYGRIQITVVDG